MVKYAYHGSTPHAVDPLSMTLNANDSSSGMVNVTSQKKESIRVAKKEPNSAAMVVHIIPSRIDNIGLPFLKIPETQKNIKMAVKTNNSNRNMIPVKTSTEMDLVISPEMNIPNAMLTSGKHTKLGRNLEE